MPAQIIDGKAIAESVRNQVAVETQQLISDTGIIPHLAAVLVGNDPASEVYVRNKERACQKAGLKWTRRRLKSNC
jgi:methylenetetrahydrofolate dehydrogenase (NADP+)/methenyltetrahydrofolate cyclohydrolase